MILCEVALGDMKVLSNAQSMSRSTLPSGKSCVMGLGKYQPDPSGNKFLDGVRVPIGRPRLRDNLDSSRGLPVLDYDEFIIYDVNQVHIRYLVKVKFTFT